MLEYNQMPFFKSEKPNDREVQIISARYAAIMNILRDAVIVYDNTFKVLLFNPSAAKIFGLTPEEVIGQSFTPSRAAELKYRALVQTLFPSLAPAVVNKSDPGIYPQVAEISFTEPELYLRVATSPIGEAGRNLFVKVVTDITKEVELKKAKSEFIYAAAHQLRAPLTTIGRALETLNGDPAIKGGSRETLDQGSEADKRLTKILDDLLNVSRIDEGQLGYTMEMLDLIPFLNSLLEGARDYVSKSNLKLKINFENEIGKLMLYFDPDRLGMAISNILDNAIKYNVENGEVTFRTELLKGKPYLQISISDTGIGIPKEKIPDVSTKFFRAENAKKALAEGMGLGMYISQSIIKRHGGSMWIDSEIGRGTTVYFTLPTDPKLVPTREFVYA